jgi:putative acetyltransferase
MVVRPAVLPAEAEAISALVQAAFNTSRFDEAAMVENSRAEGGAWVELVAEENGEIVGHILMNRMTVTPHKLMAGLAPVGVAPAWQGRGIGDALCRAGIEAVRALGAEAVVVLGHPDYYPRFGFSAASAARLASPYAGNPAFMAMELTPGALADPLKVDYPAAFS